MTVRLALQGQVHPSRTRFEGPDPGGAIDRLEAAEAGGADVDTLIARLEQVAAPLSSRAAVSVGMVEGALESSPALESET